MKIVLPVRHLERIPLGTSYPAVVERVKRNLGCFEGRERPSELIVDSTGVGAPVVNLFKDADLDCRVIGVSITFGGQVSQGRDGYNVLDHRNAHERSDGAGADWRRRRPPVGCAKLQNTALLRHAFSGKSGYTDPQV